jgi:hypothetical protein
MKNIINSNEFSILLYVVIAFIQAAAICTEDPRSYKFWLYTTSSALLVLKAKLSKGSPDNEEPPTPDVLTNPDKKEVK